MKRRLKPKWKQPYEICDTAWKSKQTKWIDNEQKTRMGKKVDRKMNWHEGDKKRESPMMIRKWHTSSFGDDSYVCCIMMDHSKHVLDKFRSLYYATHKNVWMDGDKWDGLDMNTQTDGLEQLQFSAICSCLLNAQSANSLSVVYRIVNGRPFMKVLLHPLFSINYFFFIVWHILLGTFVISRGIRQVFTEMLKWTCEIGYICLIATNDLIFCLVLIECQENCPRNWVQHSTTD